MENENNNNTTSVLCYYSTKEPNLYHKIQEETWYGRTGFQDQKWTRIIV